ncbi:MAG: hypothetical protein FWD98_04785 [Defluviitaleaceae bacterium]|nr:hypothetical protein [Defluviitaleaceae bacterium]
MNWDRAKTMLIVCLLALNMFLAAMYMTYDDEYVVTQDDIAVITALLAQQGISVAAAVPAGYAPVDQPLLAPASYNTNLLLAAFFADASGISQTFEFGSRIFTSPEGRLTVEGDTVVFAPSAGRFAPPSPEEFVRGNTQLFPGFVHAGTYYIGGAYVTNFFQHYAEHIIASNRLSFVSREPHGRPHEIIYTFRRPSGFVGVAQPIISAPQALFMFKLTSEHSPRPLTVSQIELIHQLPRESAAALTPAVPYYRISATHGHYATPAAPTLINAVTGEITPGDPP